MADYLENPVIVTTPLTKKQRQHNIGQYGSKIPVPYTVFLNNRRYRVYAICFSNVASHYIEVKGEQIFIHDYDLDAARQLS